MLKVSKLCNIWVIIQYLGQYLGHTATNYRLFSLWTEPDLPVSEVSKERSRDYIQCSHDSTGCKSQNKIIRAFLRPWNEDYQCLEGFRMFSSNQIKGRRFQLGLTIRQTTKNQIFENNLSRTQIILQFLLLFRHQFYTENYYIWNLQFRKTEKIGLLSLMQHFNWKKHMTQKSPLMLRSKFTSPSLAMTNFHVF